MLALRCQPAMANDMPRPKSPVAASAGAYLFCLKGGGVNARGFFLATGQQAAGEALQLSSPQDLRVKTAAAPHCRIVGCRHEPPPWRASSIDFHRQLLRSISTPAASRISPNWYSVAAAECRSQPLDRTLAEPPEVGAAASFVAGRALARSIKSVYSRHVTGSARFP